MPNLPASNDITSQEGSASASNANPWVLEGQGVYAGPLGFGTNPNVTPTQVLPWVSSNVQSVFSPSIAIDPSRWDALFPYRLLVIDTQNQNKIVNGKDYSSYRVTYSKGTSSALVDYSGTFDPQWIFELPISPQQLNIQDMFAINTVATLRGVMEEHNGVKFKMINASGTMGVWPQRSSVSKPPTSPTPLQSVFGGTIEAFGTLKNQLSSVVSTANGKSPAPKPVTPRPEAMPYEASSTGYYNAIKLQQFLEQYAEAKRDPANSGWRLVFDIPKQNQSLIVTPITYTWKQDVNKPMEIQYAFQLKAWRRIDLHNLPAQVPNSVQPISPGILQRITNTLFEARAAASAALNLLSAVTTDVEAPLNILRQTSLFVKDLAGIATSAADLPTQLQKDFKSTVADVLNNLNQSQLTGPAATDVQTLANLAKLQSGFQSKEGLSLNSVSNNQIGTSAASAQSIDPTTAIFNNPDQNYLLIDQAPTDSLALNNAQLAGVDDALETVRAFTVETFKQFRASILTLANQLSNNFGTGNAFYSKVYNTPAPIVRSTPITIDDYELLVSLYQVIQSYDILTATTEINDLSIQTNMDYVAGLAASSGISFQTTTSKVLVPVPFGLTIEAISARYLGDPQRWIEIATLNNLQDPYIDENGFQLPLLSNAIGRQIVIGDNTYLYLGQTVTLKGSGQVPTSRSILDIQLLSASSYLITLDGLANLANFTLSNNAYMQAYLPGTVNSQQKIFIPSNLPVPNEGNIIPPPIAASDPLTGMSKVDWLLTENGDIATNSYGDFRLSYGMTNIIQALKIKFGTIQGTVLLHPEFGLGVQPGTANSSIQIQDLFNQINEMVNQDPRFTGVSNLQILLNGPQLYITFGVTLAGIQGVFPVQFQLTG